MVKVIISIWNIFDEDKKLVKFLSFRLLIKAFFEKLKNIHSFS